MEIVTPWISYLSDPLILAGFALFLLVGLVKLFKTDKLTRAATRDLISKGLTFVFILGLLIVVLGFGIKWEALQNERLQVQRLESRTEQVMTGVSGTSVQSGRDSSVNVGDGTLSQLITADNSDTIPSPVSQKMENTNGLSIQSGRDSYSQSQP